MYKSFFNLKINPFASSPDPRFLYMMPHTREALATLEYGISAHKGFIVLTGEVGTGQDHAAAPCARIAGSEPRLQFVRLQSAAGCSGLSRVHPVGLRHHRRRTAPSRAC